MPYRLKDKKGVGRLRTPYRLKNYESTRTSVIVRQAEREAIHAEKEATTKVGSISEQAFHF
jgi:hypothetical protein